jgi:hypothetical protein
MSIADSGAPFEVDPGVMGGEGSREREVGLAAAISKWDGRGFRAAVATKGCLR